MKVVTLALLPLLCTSVFADNHDVCPEGTYPRGNTCDSCPWEDTFEKYKNGELSITRNSEVFEHAIRVSVACDANRPIDVDDVFEKIEQTERVFRDVFGSAIQHGDGEGFVLEIITGICDYEEGGHLSTDVTDDCNMYELCNQLGGNGCSVTSGQAFARLQGEHSHTAFVPYFKEGKYWWVEGNRYANLQHEFTHLLDFTYLRGDDRGTEVNWWIEGLPQFIQWKILNDELSWNRGNDEAHVLEIFMDRWNVSNYYDGMRIIALLERYSPSLLGEIAKEIRDGVYSTNDSHLAWVYLLAYTSLRYEDAYRDFVEDEEDVITMPLHDGEPIVGIVEGVDIPDYSNQESETTLIESDEREAQ